MGQVAALAKAVVVGLEIPVVIHPLGEIVLPGWLAGEVIATKI